MSDLNVIHRDLKLANILVHFKDIEQEFVEQGGQKYKTFKQTTDLVGKVDIVIADLGFAKQLQEDLT